MIPVSELLTSPEFWFGSALLGFFQIGKFGEINSVSEDFREQSAVIPNLRARDFVGTQAYLGYLTLFVLVTIAAYFMVCLASPALISGWIRVTQGALTESQIAAIVESVPYPLFIAASFMGLAHRSVPGFSSILGVQRDIFHELVGVPRVVIQTSSDLSTQILAGCTRKEDLQARLVQLTSNAWIGSLRKFADEKFFKNELARLKLAGTSFADSSQREMENLLELLVYAAAIAAVKESGGDGLRKLASALKVEMPAERSLPVGLILASLLWSVTGLTILWFSIPMCEPLVRALFAAEQLRFWPGGPDALPESGKYLLAQVVPVILATLVLLTMLPTQENNNADSDSNKRSPRSIFESNAGLFLTIAIVVIAFDYLQALTDYGTSPQNDSRKYWTSFPGFIRYWLPYVGLHSLLSVAICFVLLRYIIRKTEDQDVNAGFRAWALMTGVVLSGAVFYSFARLTYQFNDPLAFDYVLLIVILNMSAAAIAMLIARSVGSWRRNQKRNAKTLPLASVFVPGAKVVPLDKGAAEQRSGQEAG